MQCIHISGWIVSESRNIIITQGAIMKAFWIVFFELLDLMYYLRPEWASDGHQSVVREDGEVEGLHVEEEEDEEEASEAMVVGDELSAEQERIQ